MPSRKRKAAPDDHGNNPPTPRPSTENRPPSRVDWSKIREDFDFKITKVSRSKVSHVGRTPNPNNNSGDLRSYDYEDDEVGPDRYQAPPFGGTKVGAMCYRVEPSYIWLAATRYKKCNVKDEVFSIGDFVYVQNQNPTVPPASSAEERSRLWIAKILEIRAGDHEHAWVRIHWMYWPEELPGGRRPYHANNELIASNHMDIVDAQSLDGIALVKHWSEDDDSDVAAQDLIWRQTLDVSTKKLSQLNLHCKDLRECNPNELLILCDSCNAWQHASCLEVEGVRLQYMENEMLFPTVSSKTNKTKSSQSVSWKGTASTSAGSASKSAASTPSTENLVFSAQLRIVKGNKLILRFRDKRLDSYGKVWQTSAINCLLCDQPLNTEDVDPASDDMFEVGANANANANTLDCLFVNGEISSSIAGVNHRTSKSPDSVFFGEQKGKSPSATDLEAAPRPSDVEISLASKGLANTVKKRKAQTTTGDLAR